MRTSRQTSGFTFLPTWPHGFDLSFEKASLFETVRENSSIVAEELGKTLVSVKTNARSVLQNVDWRYSHGSILVGVGLALGGLFHTIFIPATDAFLDVIVPWGLDPLWSTEQLAFIYDGGEARRADRIRFISSSPLALRFLRVCWENRNGAYNCGRCEKCLQTMVDLTLCGALERAERFSGKIDLRDLRRLVIPKYELVYWNHTLRLAREAAIDEGLRKEVEMAVGRSVRAARLGRIGAAAGTVLSRFGLTPEKIRTVDRQAFGGTGLAIFRWLRRHMRRDLYAR